MEKIWKSLVDPSWWFTTFFIAVIASLLAAYAKDILSLPLSALSKKYKAWQEKVRAKEHAEQELTAKNPVLLVILFGRLLLDLVLLTFCAIVLLLLHVAASQSTTLIFLGARIETPLLSYTSAAFMVILATVVCAYLFGARVRKFRKSYRFYLNQISATHY